MGYGSSHNLISSQYQTLGTGGTGSSTYGNNVKITTSRITANDGVTGTRLEGSYSGREGGRETGRETGREVPTTTRKYQFHEKKYENGREAWWDITYLMKPDLYFYVESRVHCMRKLSGLSKIDKSINSWVYSLTLSLFWFSSNCALLCNQVDNNRPFSIEVTSFHIKQKWGMIFTINIIRLI